MKILLVRPPFVDDRFGPPIGLAYISQILKEAGHESIIYDINLDIKKDISAKMDNYNRDFVLPEGHPALDYAAKKMDEYCETILSYQPDIVGFHLSYPTEKFGNRLAKRISKQVRCIAGGPQTTFVQEKLLQHGCYDAIVVGYGEEAVLEAVEKSGIIEKSLKRDRNYSPDFSDIPIDYYKGVLPVVTTRGCPNRCNFCTQSYSYFFHSIDSVVRQIGETANIKKVMYNDSNINVNSRRTEELFAELAKLDQKPFGHIFGMQIKKDFERYIPKMAEAGVREVRLGIESGSLRERRSMNKIEFSNDLALDFIKQLSDHKIVSFVQFIFCFPDQTEQDRNETLSFVEKINNVCDPKYIKHIFNKFVVHIGTEEYFKEHFGVIKDSPQHWENSLINPEKLKKIAAKFEKSLPENSKLYL